MDTNLVLLRNADEFSSWKQKNIDEREGDVCEQPKQFPCYATITVLDWNQEEMKAVYFYREDLEKMLSEMPLCEDDFLNISIESIKLVLSGRSRRTLEYWNSYADHHKFPRINTIGDFLATPESKILKMDNFGKKSLQEIKNAIDHLRISMPELG